MEYGAVKHTNLVRINFQNLGIDKIYPRTNAASHTFWKTNVAHSIHDEKKEGRGHYGGILSIFTLMDYIFTNSTNFEGKGRTSYKQTRIISLKEA